MIMRMGIRFRVRNTPRYVTVNSEDGKQRVNRLRLLSEIRATMGRIADFGQIEG